MANFTANFSETRSDTDTLRLTRWNYVIELRASVILRDGKVKVSRALAGDQPQKVRARYWQRQTSLHGLEAMYLAQQAIQASQASREAQTEPEALELAVKAKDLREKHNAEQSRYEVCGHYDALALREVIRGEVRQSWTAEQGKEVIQEEIFSKVQAESFTQREQRLETYLQQLEATLLDASPNAPNKIKKDQNSKEYLT